MAEKDFYSINPWLNIWGHPKQTMRYILDHYPGRLNHTLIIIGAFTHIAGAPGLVWDAFFVSLFSLIFMSIIAGLIALYLQGGLIRWTGNWIGGVASCKQVMSAVAWSQIPAICLFFIQMIVLLLVQGDTLNIFYTTLRLIFIIGTFIIFICCVAEAQKFSFLKALFNFVLSFIFLILIMAIVTMIINFFIMSPISSS